VDADQLNLHLFFYPSYQCPNDWHYKWFGVICMNKTFNDRLESACYPAAGDRKLRKKLMPDKTACQVGGKLPMEQPQRAENKFLVTAEGWSNALL
jgi:hypothetical protein